MQRSPRARLSKLARGGVLRALRSLAGRLSGLELVIGCDWLLTVLLAREVSRAPR